MTAFKQENLDRWDAMERFMDQFNRMPQISRGQKTADFDALVKKSLETKTVQPGLMLEPTDKSVRAS